MLNNVSIHTKRLVLRSITSADAEAIFMYRSDAEANKYQGWIPDTLEDVHEFIRKISPEINVVGSWYQLAIIEKESDRLIGDVGLHFLPPENLQAELGCTLDKQFQGNGYASEALKGTIEYLFHEFGKHRIVTSIDPNNTKSIELVERIGMRKEAHFKKSLLINNEWVDDIVYALLHEDWKKST